MPRRDSYIDDIAMLKDTHKRIDKIRAARTRLLEDVEAAKATVGKVNVDRINQSYAILLKVIQESQPLAIPKEFAELSSNPSFGSYTDKVKSALDAALKSLDLILDPENIYINYNVANKDQLIERSEKFKKDHHLAPFFLPCLLALAAVPAYATSDFADEVRTRDDYRFYPEISLRIFYKNPSDKNLHEHVLKHIELLWQNNKMPQYDSEDTDFRSVVLSNSSLIQFLDMVESETPDLIEKLKQNPAYIRLQMKASSEPSSARSNPGQQYRL